MIRRPSFSSASITPAITAFAAASILAVLALLGSPAFAVPVDPPEAGEDRWADDFYAPGTGRSARNDLDRISGGFESHGEIVAFGTFTVLDNQPISHVARFDGIRWHAMEPGTSAPALLAVQDAEDVLILFADRSIRRWNGNNWTVEVPQAPDVYISAMSLWNGQIIVAVKYHAPVPPHLVERWDGTAWEPLGLELHDGSVRGLTIHGGRLVAWGRFQIEAAEPALNIAVWDGLHWQPLASGITHPVVSAAVHDEQLYVISHEGDLSRQTPHLSRWNGQAWVADDDALPGGDFLTEKLLSVGERMFVTGVFAPSSSLHWSGHEDPPYRWGLAEYVGGRLSPLEDIRGGSALDLFQYEDRLVSTGWFVSINGAAAHSVAALDANGEWKPLTGGHGFDALWPENLWPQAYPEDFVEFRGEWIAAGKFTSASGRAIVGIARYTADGWQRLGGGVDGPVTAVAVLNEKLYVAGSFEHAGGLATNGMAVWDGVAWAPFGGERIEGTVETIALYQGQIVVGGSFFYIGDLQSPNIARWNGSAWERLPGFVFGTVYDLVDYNGTLLAGGAFSWNGTRSIGAVAAWTGTEWTTFEGQPITSVRHLRLHAGELVATSQAPGENRRLLRWTGSTWTPVGQQPDADCDDFARYQGELIGCFSWIEYVSANGYRHYGRLYRLQGSEWVPLSRRFETEVRVLAPFDGSLYCAGPFVEIDGHRAAGVARWDGTPTAVAVQDLTAASMHTGIVIAWQVAATAAADIVSVRVERSAGGDPFVSLGTFDASPLEQAPGAYEWTDRDVSPGVAYAYRIGLHEPSGEITWAGPVSATAAAVAFGVAPIAMPRNDNPVRIDYGIAVAGDMSLDVYDVRGRIVRRVAAGRLAAGRYTATWDRRQERGSRVASGIYFVRLRADARDAIQRVVLTN